MPEKTTYELVVIEPFGKYARGDHITDQKEMAAVLDSDAAGNVVKRLLVNVIIA